MIFHLLHLAESLLSYEPSDRFLHRINPLTKVALFVVVIVGGMIISGPNYPWYLNFAVTLVLVALSATGGIPLRKELRLRGVYVLAIVLIILIGNLVFSRGGEGGTYNATTPQVYFELPPFIYITSVSLNFALGKTLYILNSILVIIVLLKSTRLSDLTHSIQTVGVPYPVAMLTSTSLRCVPMVSNGLLIVYNARRARGFEMDKGGARQRIRQWGSLLGPLILVLLKWIDQMSIVFQSRGLDFGRRKRTRLRVIPFTAVDAVATTVLIGGLIALIVAASTGQLQFQIG